MTGVDGQIRIEREYQQPANRYESLGWDLQRAVLRSTDPSEGDPLTMIHERPSPEFGLDSPIIGVLGAILFQDVTLSGWESLSDWPRAGEHEAGVIHGFLGLPDVLVLTTPDPAAFVSIEVDSLGQHVKRLSYFRLSNATVVGASWYAFPDATTSSFTWRVMSRRPDGFWLVNEMEVSFRVAEEVQPAAIQWLPGIELGALVHDTRLGLSYTVGEMSANLGGQELALLEPAPALLAEVLPELLAGEKGDGVDDHE